MKFNKRAGFLTFFIFAIASISFCQSSENLDSTAKRINLFRQIFWDSLPQPSGYVNDYENLYTDDEEDILDSLILDFEKRTTVQMAIVTFDTLMMTKDSLDALTLRIAKYWGVGQKEKNNGVLIGISRGYRKIRIQNGYGIEKVLTDGETKEVVDKAFIPAFRQGRYFDGTLNGLKTLMEALIKNSEKKAINL
ncbi:TPM domain-containing protein [Aridibaculum aurantiacum]|uniref:TPM domain-containing protein n=1 Tax=Aridibaculum aurantiacum TaxID=2810307 RepID=UPI001A9743BA|nr:TPM domain-containing protein [Aridibaculum aurantiacum]